MDLNKFEECYQNSVSVLRATLLQIGVGEGTRKLSTQKIFSHIDDNNSGVISTQEMKDYILSPELDIFQGCSIQDQNNKVCELLLEQLDMDRDGEISAYELEAFLWPENQTSFPNYKEIGIVIEFARKAVKSQVASVAAAGLPEALLYEFATLSKGTVRKGNSIDTKIIKKAFSNLFIPEFSRVLAEHEVSALIHSLDGNHDGSISATEFKNWLFPGIKQQEMNNIVEYLQGFIHRYFDGDVRKMYDEFKSHGVNGVHKGDFVTLLKGFDKDISRQEANNIANRLLLGSGTSGDKIITFARLTDMVGSMSGSVSPRVRASSVDSLPSPHGVISNNTNSPRQLSPRGNPRGAFLSPQISPRGNTQRKTLQQDAPPSPQTLVRSPTVSSNVTSQTAPREPKDTENQQAHDEVVEMQEMNTPNTPVRVRKPGAGSSEGKISPRALNPVTPVVKKSEKVEGSQVVDTPLAFSASPQMLSSKATGTPSQQQQHKEEQPSSATPLSSTDVFEQTYNRVLHTLRDALLKHGGGDTSLPRRAIIQSIFKFIDDNGSGIISLQEMRDFILLPELDIFRDTDVVNDENQHERIVELLLAQLDLNRDGNVSISELEMFIWPSNTATNDSTSDFHELGLVIDYTRKAVMRQVASAAASGSDEILLQSFAALSKANHIKQGSTQDTKVIRKALLNLFIPEFQRNLNTDETELLLLSLDGNRDGAVSATEFKNFLFPGIKQRQRNNTVEILQTFIRTYFSGDVRKMYDEFKSYGVDGIHKGDFITAIKSVDKDISRPEANDLANKLIGSGTGGDKIITLARLTDMVGNMGPGSPRVRTLSMDAATMNSPVPTVGTPTATQQNSSGIDMSTVTPGSIRRQNSPKQPSVQGSPATTVTSSSQQQRMRMPPAIDTTAPPTQESAVSSISNNSVVSPKQLGSVKAPSPKSSSPMHSNRSFFGNNNKTLSPESRELFASPTASSGLQLSPLSGNLSRSRSFNSDNMPSLAPVGGALANKLSPSSSGLFRSRSFNNNNNNSNSNTNSEAIRPSLSLSTDGQHRMSPPPLSVTSPSQDMLLRASSRDSQHDARLTPSPPPVSKDHSPIYIRRIGSSDSATSTTSTSGGTSSSSFARKNVLMPLLPLDSLKAASESGSNSGGGFQPSPPGKKQQQSSPQQSPQQQARTTDNQIHMFSESPEKESQPTTSTHSQSQPQLQPHSQSQHAYMPSITEGTSEGVAAGGQDSASRSLSARQSQSVSPVSDSEEEDSSKNSRENGGKNDDCDSHSDDEVDGDKDGEDGRDVDDDSVNSMDPVVQSYEESVSVSIPQAPVRQEDANKAPSVSQEHVSSVEPAAAAAVDTEEIESQDERGPAVASSADNVTATVSMTEVSSTCGVSNDVVEPVVVSHNISIVSGLSATAETKEPEVPQVVVSDTVITIDAANADEQVSSSTASAAAAAAAIDTPHLADNAVVEPQSPYFTVAKAPTDPGTQVEKSEDKTDECMEDKSDQNPPPVSVHSETVDIQVPSISPPEPPFPAVGAESPHSEAANASDRPSKPITEEPPSPYFIKQGDLGEAALSENVTPRHEHHLAPACQTEASIRASAPGSTSNSASAASAAAKTNVADAQVHTSTEGDNTVSVEELHRIRNMLFGQNKYSNNVNQSHDSLDDESRDYGRESREIPIMTSPFKHQLSSNTSPVMAVGLTAPELKGLGYSGHTGKWRGFPYDRFTCCNTADPICPLSMSSVSVSGRDSLNSSSFANTSFTTAGSKGAAGGGPAMVQPVMNFGKFEPEAVKHRYNKAEVHTPTHLSEITAVGRSFVLKPKQATKAIRQTPLVKQPQQTKRYASPSPSTLKTRLSTGTGAVNRSNQQKQQQSIPSVRTFKIKPSRNGTNLPESIAVNPNKGSVPKPDNITSRRQSTSSAQAGTVKSPEKVPLQLHKNNILGNSPSDKKFTRQLESLQKTDADLFQSIRAQDKLVIDTQHSAAESGDDLETFYGHSSDDDSASVPVNNTSLKNSVNMQVLSEFEKQQLHRSLTERTAGAEFAADSDIADKSQNESDVLNLTKKTVDAHTEVIQKALQVVETEATNLAQTKAYETALLSLQEELNQVKEKSLQTEQHLVSQLQKYKQSVEVLETTLQKTENIVTTQILTKLHDIEKQSNINNSNHNNIGSFQQSQTCNISEHNSQSQEEPMFGGLPSMSGTIHGISPYPRRERPSFVPSRVSAAPAVSLSPVQQMAKLRIDDLFTPSQSQELLHTLDSSHRKSKAANSNKKQRSRSVPNTTRVINSNISGNAVGIANSSGLSNASNARASFDPSVSATSSSMFSASKRHAPPTQAVPWVPASQNVLNCYNRSDANSPRRRRPLVPANISQDLSMSMSVSVSSINGAKRSQSAPPRANSQHFNTTSRSATSITSTDDHERVVIPVRERVHEIVVPWVPSSQNVRHCYNKSDARSPLRRRMPEPRKINTLGTVMPSSSSANSGNSSNSSNRKPRVSNMNTPQAQAQAVAKTAVTASSTRKSTMTKQQHNTQRSSKSPGVSVPVSHSARKERLNTSATAASATSSVPFMSPPPPLSSTTTGKYDHVRYDYHTHSNNAFHTSGGRPEAQLSPQQQHLRRELTNMSPVFMRSSPTLFSRQSPSGAVTQFKNQQGDEDSGGDYGKDEFYLYNASQERKASSPVLRELLTPEQDFYRYPHQSPSFLKFNSSGNEDGLSKQLSRHTNNEEDIQTFVPAETPYPRIIRDVTSEEKMRETQDAWFQHVMDIQNKAEKQAYDHAIAEYGLKSSQTRR